MNTVFNLIENGYEVVQQTEFERVSYAQNRVTGDKFYFDVRKKQTPTFRRITKEWEFGVDVPDHVKYYAPAGINPGIPFIVFFETESPAKIYWIQRERIRTVGRRWEDPDQFPDGILFVKVSDTTEWNTSKSFPSLSTPVKTGYYPIEQRNLNRFVGG
jgi:hypothetical protein